MKIREIKVMLKILDLQYSSHLPQLIYNRYLKLKVKDFALFQEFTFHGDKEYIRCHVMKGAIASKIADIVSMLIPIAEHSNFLAM